MPPQIRDTEDVYRAMQLARGGEDDNWWGGIVFLVGAGCSVSAGIPLAEAIAREATIELARRYSNDTFKSKSSDEALEWLTRDGSLAEGLGWSQVYGELFEKHYSDPEAQRPVIRRAIERRQGINWAHLCLGELVASRFVHTILTTNFDQLLLNGIVRTGILPVVSDGIESLNRIEGRPQYPQIVHLHGSRHTYNPRNARSDVMGTARLSGFVRALQDVLRGSQALVVVGYAGGEEGVMEVLYQAARDLGQKTIFWVQYEEDPEALSPGAERLLEQTRGGGLLVGQDADAFFAEIMAGLGVGVPKWMRQPIRHFQDRSEELVAPDRPRIRREIEAYRRRLEVLGELFDSHEKERSARDRAFEEARRLALAGNPREAVKKLRRFESKFDTAEEWSSFADNAYEAGKDDPDAKLVKKAIKAFRKAIELMPSDGDAETRAALQGSLGSALRNLGEREEGTKRLEEAVEAFRAALEVYTFDRLPQDWAMTKNSLGTALSTLGEREDGTVRLEESIAAYHDALTVYTRERSPLDWAMIENNLGSALSTLGEREDGTERLEQAKAAFRDALTIYTRERMPLDWAMAMVNLGNALCALGERQENAERLVHAAEACSSALEVYTRERLPLDWAMTQNNLGNALLALGRLEDGSERLEQAEDAFCKALEVWTEESASFYRGLALKSLAKTRALLDERRGRGSGTPAPG